MAMNKHRNATKAGGSKHKDTSPALSSHGGELCDTAQDLVEEVASQIGTTPRCPLDSHNLVDCPPHAHHGLSFDGPAQSPPTIGCIIAST